MTSYFEPIDQKLFNLGDLSTFQSRDITEAIIDFSVSLSLENSSQVSVTVLDSAFTFAKANYFQVRRDIFYRNLWFEIAAVSTQRSSSIHPEYQIECRSKAIQLMKRDKRPEAYRGMSAYEFAFTIAQRFGMNFIGEQTTKKPAVVKGKTKNSDDSVWTVLKSLASEQQFICFESENTLFFGSEKFLLGKWGDPKYSFGEFKWIPFFYPETKDPVWTEAQQQYILLEQPSLRRSDDDINAASGSMLVDRFNGVNLRPGMTIFLGGIPDFEAFYLITDVTFNEGSNEPVQVQFRVPVDPDKENISTSTSQGSSPSGGNRGDNPIAPVPGLGLNRVIVEQKLSAQASRTFTTSALALMGYRGSNANAIKAIVQASVEFFNAGATLDSIRRTIKNDQSLSEDERKITDAILVTFVARKPTSTLGVSAGISNNAIDETADQIERQQRTSGTTSLLTTSGPRSAPVSLSQASRNAITTYIKANLKLSSGEREAIASSILVAQNILNIGTNSLKQREIRNVYSAAQSANTRLSKVKYNSLNQGVVLNEIIPGWNIKSSFGIQAVQIPDRFRI
jgi:hypothetical protein